MKRLLLFALLAATSLRAVPQTNTGSIEGRVIRSGTSEGIGDVQITLIGPSPGSAASSLGGLYTPNPSLTPAMREQIDRLISTAPPQIAVDWVANAVLRLEAQLLGLPAPTQVSAPQTTAVTDSQGVFRVGNLAPGRYQIRAQRDGYFGTQLPGGGTLINTIATVVAGQPTTPVSISMLRGAVLSGRVRDPNGQPMTGAQVFAFRLGYENGRRTLQQAGNKQTDDRGEYRLFWLLPGEYFIGITPRRSVAAIPNPQDAYARTFFPSTTDARNAQLVPAGEGADISGLDIVVRADATGRILGRVVSSLDGRSALASSFYLLSADAKAIRDQQFNGVNNTASDRTNGQFELRGIVPGRYELMASVPDANGRQMWGRTPVDVGAGDLNGVTLGIHPGVEVRARLAVDGAPPAYTMMVAGARGAPVRPSAAGGGPPTPVPTPTYRVQFRSAEGLGMVPFEAVANQDMTFDPSGLFVFGNVPPGKYYVAVQPLPPNGYIADVRAGGISVNDSSVDINSQTGEIQVVVRTDGGKIQGVVRDAGQAPFASARVVLVPSEARRQNFLIYNTALSDNAGNFDFSGVAPGDYKLFAWEAVPVNAWTDVDFLEPYETLGMPVKVGSTPMTVDLKVIPNDR